MLNNLFFSRFSSTSSFINSRELSQLISMFIDNVASINIVLTMVKQKLLYFDRVKSNQIKFV